MYLFSTAKIMYVTQIRSSSHAVFRIIYEWTHRGWPASLWWAPPTAWCPACTAPPRTPTLTSGACVRPPSRESAPSPPWPSPLLRPSWTSWSLRVRSLWCEFHLTGRHMYVGVASNLYSWQQNPWSETKRIVMCWLRDSHRMFKLGGWLWPFLNFHPVYLFPHNHTRMSITVQYNLGENVSSTAKLNKM